MLNTYSFIAHDKDGKKETGTLKAPSTQEAFGEVKSRGLMPIKILPVSKKEDFDFKGAIKTLKSKKQKIVERRNKIINFGLALLFMILFLLIKVIPINEVYYIGFSYSLFILVCVNFVYFFVLSSK